jgi:hypothetical protein
MLSCTGVGDVPLLLIQEKVENKDILCIYTSIHRNYNLAVLFISPTNLDDYN